jgi:competence protein ComEA
MNRKKIETFIKEYLYFTQSERKGVIGLLLILVVVIALPTLYSFVFPPQPFDVKIEQLQTKNTEQLLTNNTNKLFKFNPHTASDDELKQLGFTDKNISTLRKYVSKGGKFKKPEDLLNMYGLNKKLVEQLIPYVQLDVQTNNYPADSTVKKKQSRAPVELNSADTTQLIALYRIGPSLAKRIVEYRNKLGGFLSLNQLTEIYGFDEDILYDLDGKVYVDASKAKIHDVNTVTLEELKTHPYFKYKLSNAIVNYRQQHGNYKDLTELKRIVLINDSIYQNITRYLIIK